ncbi:hypothetical protein Vretimale_1642 [Volvox reticuliferus]|uniref:Uncharacterized protein n=1 Tax=Volvox reticuliferus TaxID=1737510 RepID=A0A8J4D4P3_9CHLO|nr:hypothetical protein Vretimale_1642 [Volvox reticuliferus]
MSCRYCRFLLLAQRHQFETLLFPPDVLLVWWAHKAHSSAYLADMDLLMGCPFDPILPSLDDALLSRRTAELYEFEFGDSYNLCFLTMDTADSPLAAAALVSRLSQQLRPLLRSLDGACSEEGRPSSGIGHGSPSRSLRSSDEGVLRQPTVPEPQMQSSGFSGKSGGGVATTASRRLVGVSLGATVHQRTDRLALLSKMIGVLGKLQGGVRRWQTCLADPDARGMTRPPSEGIAVGKQLHQREVGPPAEEAVARASDFAVEAGPPVRLAGVGVRIGTAGDNGADTDGPVPASSATVALASGMVATVGDGGAGVTAGPDRQSTGAEIATAVVAASAMPLGLPSGLPLCSEVLAVFNQATSGCAAGCVGRHRSSTGIQTSLTGATLGNPVAHVPRAGAAVRYLLWLLEREYAHLTRAATVDAATAAASTSAHGSDGGGGPRPLVRSRRGLARMLNNGGFAAIAAAAAAKRTRKEQIAASKALAKAMARHTASFGAFGNLPMMSSHPFLEDCCPGAFAGGAGDSSGLQPVVSMGLMAVLNSETWEAALAKAVTTLAGTKTVAKAARKKKASGHRA